MDRKLYFNQLYDYYGVLLTDKQRSYFEDYYFRDFSLSEIAENDGVSRNAIHKQLKLVGEKLEQYEAQLHLLEKRGKILSLLQNVAEEIRYQVEELL